MNGSRWLALVWLFVLGTASAGSISVPADVSVSLSAEPSTGLVTGQPVTFTISVTNHGPDPVPVLGIASSEFTTEFALGGAYSDCQNTLGLVVADGEYHYLYYYNWVPTFAGILQVGETRNCYLTLPLSASAPSELTFGFGVPEFFTDIDPSNNSASVTLRRAREPAIAVPVSSRSALAALAMLVALLGGAALAKRSGLSGPDGRTPG